MERQAQILIGDALETLEALPAGHARTCVTSPPYWGLRDYGVSGQLGLEATPDEYVSRLVEVFREVRRVLAEDGTLWLNLGDSYAGSDATKGGDGSSSALGEQSTDTEWARQQQKMRTEQDGIKKASGSLKPKDLVGIPWRVALALQDDGWWLRSDIIWHKPNPMPESVTDRPTTSHEHIFLLSKSKQYYYDADAIREEAVVDAGRLVPVGGNSQNGTMRNDQDRWNEDDGTRNKRDVWSVSTKPYPEAHFAVYPPDLIEPCIEAGSAKGDTVLDPFAGAGTTGLVALAKGRSFTGIELNEEYADMAHDRIRNDAPLMNEVTIEPASVLGAERQKLSCAANQP
jgi:site-specific DNA-methyltransferase (adenine-specific)